jgi:hypothetical protein
MQLISQVKALRSISDKFFHQLQLVNSACFESARVVKYEIWIAFENQLVVDIVLSTLYM